MKIEYKEISEVALQYLDQATLTKLTEFITRWEQEIEAYFFQVSQSQNVPQIEFGAHIGVALFDFSISKDSLTISMLPLDAICGIFFDEGMNFTRLRIQSSTQPQLHYHAVLQKNREQLKEYAEHLYRIFIGKNK